MRALSNVANDTRLISAGAAYTLTTQDQGATVALDTAAGSTVTLPKSVGDNGVYRFVITAVAATANHIVQVGNTTDVINGTVMSIDSDTAGTIKGFVTNATNDTITLSGSATGGVTKGEWLEVRDVAAGVFVVTGVVAFTGTGATPFSAAV